MGNGSGSSLRGWSLRPGQEGQSETASRTDGRFWVLWSFCQGTARGDGDLQRAAGQWREHRQIAVAGNWQFEHGRSKIRIANDEQRGVGSLRMERWQQFAG